MSQYVPESEVTMSDVHAKDEDSARASIEQDVKAFLAGQNRDSELGVFHSTWQIYRNLPLARFAKAAPRTDRMLLPGMEAAVDVATIAIQTFARVWEKMLSSESIYSGLTLFKLVKEQAIAAGSTKVVAESLAEFFTGRHGAGEERQ
jgi:hypothetical protein